MSENTETVSFSATEDLHGRIEAYQDDGDFDNRSNAIRDLIETGLREQSSPILWRAKDRVVDWASILAIAAIVVFISGATTSALPFTSALKFSFSLFVVAVLMLAGFETARMLAGTNSMGVWVRERWGESA